jgi:hypothetical protein
VVSHPRAPLGARNLRPVNAPLAIRVRADAGGYPLAVLRPGWAAPRAVARIQDRWRIDDEWWRAHPISRLYYVVLLADGRLLTLYRDRAADRWFTQKC